MSSWLNDKSTTAQRIKFNLLLVHHSVKVVMTIGYTRMPVLQMFEFENKVGSWNIKPPFM